ncbi:hypothetical protein DPMN_163014 [Dreissena polymorpha]|uniref:Uncharacterized protein n=1 Tax=Dreissena polymorpha TaxID=45954 RepID=A0A9D4IQZ3_DREPO|nr:hypothetical protein DPMN_163014 [Dreissena polymorpha]
MSRWQAEQTCFLELPNRLNLSVLVSKNADQPWDVELTDDSNRAEQRRKRRRRFKKRNIAEKVNGTCKQEMCLKKEFYYCDSTLQKQGLSRSDEKEEDFKKESLLQLRPITRKEIQQLCLDSSHETYIAVTVPHVAVLPETSQLYYQASSDNKAPLWKQHNKKLYCKTSSDSKAPEHATQYKKCQFANLDVDTE